VQNIVTSISIYGIKGITSIYNPKVNKDQLSSSYLYVRNGDTNEIRVGWHVSFNLFYYYHNILFYLKNVC
jgi:hypothetical protein